VKLVFESFPVIVMNLYMAWKDIKDFDPRIWKYFSNTR